MVNFWQNTPGQLWQPGWHHRFYNRAWARVGKALAFQFLPGLVKNLLSGLLLYKQDTNRKISHVVIWFDYGIIRKCFYLNKINIKNIITHIKSLQDYHLFMIQPIRKVIHVIAIDDIFLLCYSHWQPYTELSKYSPCIVLQLYWSLPEKNNKESSISFLPNL